MSSLPPGESSPGTGSSPAGPASPAGPPPPAGSPSLPAPPGGFTPAFGAAAPKSKIGPMRVLLFVAVGLLMLVGALIIVWWVGGGMGLGLFLAASAIALLPVPFLVAWFLWLDRFDPPSSWRYPAFAFAWGACVATASSLIVNTGAAWLFEQAGLREVLAGVWVAPVIEEVTKGLAPALLLWLRRREVVGIADAVMYAGLSATGFAMTENVLYLGRVYISGEQMLGEYGAVLGVVGLIVMRLGLTGFIHPLFTSVTGIGVGLAARTPAVGLRVVYLLAGLAGAMLLHGTWNFVAILVREQPSVGYIAYLYFLVALPLLFAMVVLSLWARYVPGRTIRRMLPEYVRAGWLSPPEFASLITPRRRLWARRWAREVAGPDGLRAMRGYQAAATKLALLREARARGLTDAEPADPERRLLGELTGYRQIFTARDATVPKAWWNGSRYLITFPDGSEHPADPPHSAVMPVPVARHAMAPMWYPPGGFGPVHK